MNSQLNISNHTDAVGQNLSAIDDFDDTRESTDALLILSTVILLLSVFFGVVGNVLVCLSVYGNRSLRTANNALLVNLAVGDLVVCFTSTPIMLAGTLNNLGWTCNPYNDILCATQTIVHVISSSVQLITLVAISVERYEAIMHPFETKQKRRRVLAGITTSWVSAVLLSVPTAVFFQNSSLYLLCACQLTDEPNIDYIHIAIIAPLGLVCLLGVMIFYLKIFRTVRKHVKENKSKSNSITSHAGNDTTTRPVSSRLCCCWRRNVIAPIAVPVTLRNQGRDPAVQINVLPGTSGDLLQGNPENKKGDSRESSPNTAASKSLLETKQGPCVVTGIPEVHQQSMTSSDTGVGSCGIAQEPPENEPGIQPNDGQRGFDHLQANATLFTVTPASPSNIYQAVDEDKASSLSPAASAADKDTASGGAVGGLNVDAGLERDPHRLSCISGDIQGSVCVMNPETRARGKRRVELKTAKRASYIIGVFSLCWLPLFVVSYVDTRPNLDILVTCIATMSAALNPLVYTVVNKAFRTEFVKILTKATNRCPCLRKP
ncbi:probable G-protein coupled receptor No18 [Asterias rubens]|uniref:probable G-protein coupled receptor No18 n=1 Tax=Asterias rubens TaxID=7604 RepID=UPI001455C6DB|nr:probable G-protein coupled receptor No18 [Asterias rubens]